MKYTTFNIKAKNGMMYTTSKTEEAGYVQNEYTDRETGKTAINYHRELASLSGKLHSLKLKESKIGERIAISLTQANGDAYILEIPVFGKGTNINDYAKSFIQIAENLVLGAETTIELNKTSKNAKGYLYGNIYASQDGEKIQWAFPLFGPESPLPKMVEKTSKVKGTKTYDFEDQSAWLYDKLKKVTNNVTVQQPTTASDTANTKAPAETAADETPVGDVQDDLPF